MANTSLLGSYGDNSGAGLMFRNVLINGGFDVWQRGTTGASGFVADRWYSVNTSAIAQSTDVPNSVSKNSISITGTVAFPLLIQRIEGINARHLADKQITISFWAKCTGTHNLYVEFGVPSTTEDTFGSYPSGSVSAINTSILSASPSSSWTFYSATITAPTTVTRGLQIIIGRGNVAASSTTQIAQVQLEAGTTPTPFERRPVGLELSLCHRYCYVFRSSLFNYIGFGGMETSSVCNVAMFLPQIMRTTPTLESYANPSSIMFEYSTGGVMATNYTAMGINGTAFSTSYRLQFTGGTGGTSQAVGAVRSQTAEVKAVIAAEL